MSLSPDERLYYRPGIGVESTSSELAASYREGRVRPDEILRTDGRQLTFSEAVREDSMLRERVGPLPPPVRCNKRSWHDELRFRHRVWKQVVVAGDVSLAPYLDRIARLENKLRTAGFYSERKQAQRKAAISRIEASWRLFYAEMDAKTTAYSACMEAVFERARETMQSAVASMQNWIAACQEQQAICGEYIGNMESMVARFIHADGRTVQIGKSLAPAVVVKALASFAPSVSMNRVLAIYRGRRGTGILLAHDGIHMSNGSSESFIPWASDIKLAIQKELFSKSATILMGGQMVGRVAFASKTGLEQFLHDVETLCQNIPVVPTSLPYLSAANEIVQLQRELPLPPALEMPEFPEPAMDDIGGVPNETESTMPPMEQEDESLGTAGKMADSASFGKQFLAACVGFGLAILIGWWNPGKIIPLATSNKDKPSRQTNLVVNNGEIQSATCHANAPPPTDSTRTEQEMRETDLDGDASGQKQGTPASPEESRGSTENGLAGLDHQGNEDDATALLRQARSGDKEAQIKVGNLHLEGFAIDDTPKESVQWVLLADPKGTKGAREWISRQADSGNAAAQWVCGRMAERAGRKEEALQWYRKAASQDYDRARKSLFRLGVAE